MALTSVAQTPVPSARLMEVTPEMAEAWLGKNTNNRNVRDAKVQTYSKAIRDEAWMITGEGIKFDWNGRMIDGQHRLLSIIDTGIPVWMFVFDYLNPDVQSVIDTGLRRSASDALKFAGLAAVNASTVAAVAAMGVRWEAGYLKRSHEGSGRREVTNTEVIDWVRNNPDITDAVNVGAYVARQIGIPPGTLCFAVLRLRRVDAMATDEFLGKLGNMMTAGEGDPLFTLLRRLRSAKENRESMRPSQYLYLIFRTWNAWRKGEQLKTLRTGKVSTQGLPGEPRTITPISIPDPL